MKNSNLLELAKQGNVEAIASLMNRQLQTKGITAKIALKDACLQVLLEFSEVPNQQYLVTFIRKGITNLKITSIERVKIYGKQIGDEFPVWSSEFELAVQMDSTNILENTKYQKNEYYEIEGSNGQIRLTRNRVIISRKGTTAFITQGIKGEKEIPISRITAIQFKRYDSLTKGYLQFSIQGGLESTGGVFAAVKDENTVMFTDLQEPKFEEIKRYIDSIIDGEPIDFNTLRFSELNAITQQTKEKINVYNKTYNEKLFNKIIKPLLVISFVLFIIMSFSPDESALKVLSGLAFITSVACLIVGFTRFKRAVT